MSDSADKVLEKLDAISNELAQTRGELAATRGELADVREKLTHREKILVGWKEVAAYLGYSEDHVKELGTEGPDPIPHVKRRGMIEARATALDAWLHRNRIPGQRRAAKPAVTGEVVQGPRKQLGLFGESATTPQRGRSSNGRAS